MLSGLISLKIVRKVDMLICGSITAIIGIYIYGWLTYGTIMALIGALFSSLSYGLTFPVIHSAIPILVDDTTKGTAYGVVAAMSSGTLAISYFIVGMLTNDVDGEIKYINVRVYLLILLILSMLIYMLLYIMDIKCNNSILKLNEPNKHTSEGK